MSLHWPDDEAPTGPARRAPPPPGNPSGSRLEMFHPTLRVSDPVLDDVSETRGGRGLSRQIPVLIAIAVLLVLGAVLFLLGPLPTVFPTLNCGDCFPLRP